MKHSLPDPNEEQRHITALYHRMRSGYDQPALRFFQRVAQWLVELTQPQLVVPRLNVATGTGAAALCLADKVAPPEQVIGLDLVVAVLTQAQHNVTRAGWSQVDLRQGAHKIVHTGPHSLATDRRVGGGQRSVA